VSPTLPMSWRANTLAVGAGVMADLALGEPTFDPHPVSAFGQVMHKVEAALYRDRRSAGVLHTAAGVAIGVVAGRLVRSTAAATYVSVAHTALMEAALDIARALEAGDLPAARDLLPTLVGRDPTDLGAAEISRAVVESLAENTVDAVVAPILWALAAGAPGALGYRAVNTMDATVGYRNERYGNYGWASARLDDVANFIPARVTAALVVLVRPGAFGAVWRAVRQDAPQHPSPNAGVAEAAFAAALGLRLGGVNRYGSVEERRAALGHGRLPECRDIAATVTLCRHVTYAVVALLVLFGTLG
jgi:adenosylcobinamide-phosphate synthase